MNRRMRLAARLYPAAWRARYGEEFAALLEDAGGGWREWLDVLWGAVKMQIRMGNFAKLAAGCAVAGVAIAGWIALRMPDQYASSAMLRVNATNRSVVFRTLSRAEADVLSRGSLAEIVQKLDLYETERQRMPMEDVVERMRNHDIRITPFTDPWADAPLTFQVQFAYPDPAAAEGATALLSTRLAQATDSVKVEVLRPASPPARLPQPNRIAIVALGLVGGLAVALLVFGVRRWPTVAAWGATAAVLAGGFSFLIANRYTSTTVLRFDSPEKAPELIKKALSDESLARIIQQPRLDMYHRERQKMTIGRVVKQMRTRDLRMQQIAGGLAISFTYPNRYKAQELLREVDSRILEAAAPPFVPSLSYTPEGVLRSWIRPAPPIEILDPASFPVQPVSPNRAAIAAFGLAAGLALGAIARAIRGTAQQVRPATA